MTPICPDTPHARHLMELTTHLRLYYKEYIRCMMFSVYIHPIYYKFLNFLDLTLWCLSFENLWKVCYWWIINEKIKQNFSYFNNTGQQRKKRLNNNAWFNKLYCTRFWSPFFLESKSFYKKLFWSSKNHQF